MKITSKSKCSKCGGRGIVTVTGIPASCRTCGGSGTVATYEKLSVGQRAKLSHGALVTITRVRRNDRYSARTDGMAFDLEWHASELQEA